MRPWPPPCLAIHDMRGSGGGGGRMAALGGDARVGGTLAAAHSLSLSTRSLRTLATQGGDVARRRLPIAYRLLAITYGRWLTLCSRR